MPGNRAFRRLSARIEQLKAENCRLRIQVEDAYASAENAAYYASEQAERATRRADEAEREANEARRRHEDFEYSVANATRDLERARGDEWAEARAKRKLEEVVRWGW